MLLPTARLSYSWLIREIISEVFRVSLVVYIIYYLINLFIPGFISTFFNLNILLVIIIFSGLITMAVMPDQESDKPSRASWKRYLSLIILAILVGFSVYYLTRPAGKVSWVLASLVSFISAVLFLTSGNDHLNENK